MPAGLDDTSTLLQAVLESSPEVIVFALDRDYRYLAFNQRHHDAMQAIWGKQIVVGQSMLDVISSDGDREKARMGFDRALAGESFTVEDEYGDTELQRLYWQNFFAPIRNGDGFVVGLTVFVLNITERRRAERALALREQEFRTLVENTTDCIARHGTDLRRTYVNPAFAALVDGGEVALLGTTPAQCPGGENAVEFEELMADVLRTGRPSELELLWSPAPGRELCTLMSMTPELDADGHVASVLVVGRDVTELHASRRKIHQMAFHDSLTGLPNRALFSDRVQQTLADARWNGQLAGLMLIDLDRFKAINDTLGHAAGDELLREVARRLTSAVRPYDTVARLGGDEFMVLLPDVRAAADVGRIAENLLEQFQRSFSLEGQDVYVTCSIGVALFPDDSTEPEDLTKFADSAMYHAKQAGRNAFRCYSADMTEGAQDRIALEVALGSALERNELVVHYQPLVDVRTGAVLGSEALLRWRHPQEGLVPPGRFLQVAEDSGLIVDIGRWVLRQACAVAVLRNGPGRPPHIVSVNLSARQFDSSPLVEDVREILAETGCRPQWLELEVTESVLQDRSGRLQAQLLALRELGVTIALDDFGTGESALGYLTRFPLDTLKIDPVFVHEATAERPGLVAAVLSLAESLGMRLVAEGVETAEQARVLREHGCLLAQGFWYSPPLDEKRFAGLPTTLPAAVPAPRSGDVLDGGQARAERTAS